VHIRGCRIFITGAGHGLGKAIAASCLAAGGQVVISDRDADRIRLTVDELRHAGDICGYPLDVTMPEQIARVREQVLRERGPIDILVNNAGVAFGGRFDEVPHDRHALTIAVNLAGTLAVTHAFLPDLIARPASHIVNIASAAAVLPLPHGVSYAASKWGVLGFSDSLREELRLAGHRHIGVTAMCPSFITTGLFAGVQPARCTRWLTPEAVAAAVVRAIEKNRSFVMLPRSAALMYAMCRCLPRSWYGWICRRLGVSTTMVNWRGHETPAQVQSKEPVSNNASTSR
jgi:short-subunit dehydrogenase